MMVRVFKTGTGKAESAIAYLMGKNDHTGKPRAVEPEWLHGSPNLFQLISNSTARKHKYVSGAISFRDTEHPNEEQVQNVITAFKASFLPGLKEENNYADGWFAHRDKGNLELHFVVAATEIQTGRPLNIHPPGKRNIQHFQAFTQVINHTLGFDQVTPDPLKIALSDFEAKTDAGKQARRVKRLLSNELYGHIVSGRIANRSGLITHLEHNYGEVTRIGKDYISIKLPGSSKAKRLTGPLFQEDADYQALIKQNQQSKKPQRLSAEDATQAKAMLEKLTLERAGYFAQRYKTKTTFKRTSSGKGLKAGRGNAASNQKTPLIQAKAPHVPASPAALPTQRVVAAISAQTVVDISKAHRTITRRVPENLSAEESSHNNTADPVSATSVLGMEMEIGSLAGLVFKLMNRARTTTNTAYYEILHAQIVKLQHQMEGVSYRMQAEKARAIQDEQQADSDNKPKI